MHGSQLRVMFAFSSSHAFGWAYYNQMAFAAVRLVVCCINLSTLEIRIAQTKWPDLTHAHLLNQGAPDSASNKKRPEVTLAHVFNQGATDSVSNKNEHLKTSKCRACKQKVKTAQKLNKRK